MSSQISLRKISIRIGNSMQHPSGSEFALADKVIDGLAKQEVSEAIMDAYSKNKSRVYPATGNSLVSREKLRVWFRKIRVLQMPSPPVGFAPLAMLSPQGEGGGHLQNNQTTEAVVPLYGAFAKQHRIWLTMGMYQHIVGPANDSWEKRKKNIDDICDDPAVQSLNKTIDSEIATLKVQITDVTGELKAARPVFESATKEKQDAESCISNLRKNEAAFQAEFVEHCNVDLRLPSGTILFAKDDKQRHADAVQKVAPQRIKLHASAAAYGEAKHRYAMFPKGISRGLYWVILTILGMGEWYTNIQFFQSALGTFGYKLPLVSVVVLAVIVLVIMLVASHLVGKSLAWLSKYAKNTANPNVSRHCAFLTIAVYFLSSLVSVFYLIWYSRTSAYQLASMAHRKFIVALIPNLLLLFGGSIVGYYREKQDNPAIDALKTAKKNAKRTLKTDKTECQQLERDLARTKDGIVSALSNTLQELRSSAESAGLKVKRLEVNLDGLEKSLTEKEGMKTLLLSLFDCQSKLVKQWNDNINALLANYRNKVRWYAANPNAVFFRHGIFTKRGKLVILRYKLLYFIRLSPVKLPIDIRVKFKVLDAEAESDDFDNVDNELRLEYDFGSHYSL